MFLKMKGGSISDCIGVVGINPNHHKQIKIYGHPNNNTWPYQECGGLVPSLCIGRIFDIKDTNEPLLNVG